MDVKETHGSYIYITGLIITCGASKQREKTLEIFCMTHENGKIALTYSWYSSTTSSLSDMADLSIKERFHKFTSQQSATICLNLVAYRHIDNVITPTRGSDAGQRADGGSRVQQERDQRLKVVSEYCGTV